MVKTINIIRRIGSKQNDIKHFSHLLPLEVETVIEPFGGSFAVIKFVYKDINKYKFHINDFDDSLYYIYTHFEEYLQAFDIINEFYNKLEGYNYEKGIKIKAYIDELKINDIIKEYIKLNFFIRGGIFKPLKNKNYDENERSILINSLFANEDYINIFNKYKNDEKAFIFIDPPYLFFNMTSMIIDILELLKTAKCKVMLIINKLNILEYLFKDFIRGEYLKTYSLTKKKMKHLIITNY